MITKLQLHYQNQLKFCASGLSRENSFLLTSYQNALELTSVIQDVPFGVAVLVSLQRENSPNTEEEEEEMEMEIEESPVAEEKESMISDFFDDLPVGAKLMDTRMPPNLSPPESKTKDDYSFFTYSYSTCLTADDNGRRVDSTRRRYEDSAGRLKAQHKRRIGTRALESTWKRASEKDDGTHEHKVSSGSVEDFEKAWKSTPFGGAEEHAKAQGVTKQSVLPDHPEAQELP
ncbi:unnamed protein product [Peronospora farinosa]|uniref:Uncharacterized protein n=1 Tax=Peronospora farinosa TaxID=134698 RepID=A0ABN8CKA9_9STRA|nr:unnamed protein product [Peronospora farinosa]